MVNKIVKNFIEALKRVPESNYDMERTYLGKERINVFKDHFTTYENNFVSKLYAQYSMLLDRELIEDQKELVADLQIPKMFKYSKMEDKNIVRSIEMLGRDPDVEFSEFPELTIIPDFFIHKGPRDNHPDNQLLIAEVKTEPALPYGRFAWDFFKLVIYLNKMNFQNAVFLVVGVTQEMVVKYLEKYILNKLYLPLKYAKLWIIVKPKYGQEEIVINFQDFFDGKFKRPDVFRGAAKRPSKF